LAENYNDYGDYSEELVYQSKSKIKKFFSWRTLKTLLKVIGILLILFVYGILFFRLCSGKPPKVFSNLIWTEKMLAAYTESGGNMPVYSQEPAEHVARDGYFGIYDIRYIPTTKELQLTVRYNNSSTDKLYNELYAKKTEERKNEILAKLKEENPEASTTALHSLAEAEYEASVTENPIEIHLSDQPFVFILRDNYGRVYTSYCYLSAEKNVYQYLHIVFENVNLFGDNKSTPLYEYPTPEVNNPSDIYKGANAAKGNEITHLYLDMYYEGDVNFNSEAFAYPLLVYRSIAGLKHYQYTKGELSPVITEGLTYIDVKETSDPN